MVTQELLDYIKAQQQQGISGDAIKLTLLSHGWLQPDIDTAFDGLRKIEDVSPVQLSPDMRLQNPKGNLVKKLGLVTLIVMAFLAFTTGGVFAYFYFFPTPEMVFARMWSNFQNIHQFHYDGNIDVNMHMNAPSTPIVAPDDTLTQQIPAIPLSKDNHIKASFAGYTDISVLNRPQGKIAVTLSANLLEEGDSSITLEQLNVDPERMYFKFTKTENMSFINLDPIKSDWIFYDTKSYAHELNSQDALTKDQTEKLTKLAERRKFFVISKTLPSEKINGSETHHYAYSINTTELKAFMVEASTIIKGSKLTDSELRQMNSSLDDEFKSVKNIEGEMWIGKRDYYPYKFTLSFVIEDKYSSSKFRGELSYKNFNKKISLYPPSDPISTEIALKKVLSAMYPDDNKNGVPDIYETQGGVIPSY